MNQRLSISLLLGVVFGLSMAVALVIAPPGATSATAWAQSPLPTPTATFTPTPTDTTVPREPAFTVGDIAANLPGPVAATDQLISFTVVFTDPSVVNTHIAVWDWGDHSSDRCPPDRVECSVDQDSDRVTGSHVYTEPGVYTVELTVMDDGGGGRASNTVELEVLENQPPDCSNAGPGIDTIWPPNHKFVAVNVLGVTDPDADPVSITIDSIYQDEPLGTFGDGSFTPDGQGVGTGTAQVRAERVGTTIEVPGNGRVYHIGFSADDGHGVCSGQVLVGVPHDNKDIPVDDGALYDSTASTP
jgi:hypothetical protein